MKYELEIVRAQSRRLAAQHMHIASTERPQRTTRDEAEHYCPVGSCRRAIAALAERERVYEQRLIGAALSSLDVQCSSPRPG